MALTEQESLADRLGRFPAERYPVQHATTQFHLGTAALHAGDVASALTALTVASEVFERSGLRLERAKARMMLGVALRTAGRLHDAEAALVSAAAEFAAVQAPTEQAAAAYNLGLVRQDAGDPDAARAAWTQAAALFLAAGYPAQAAAAARDHGASLLSAGDAPAALPLLEQALRLAEQGDDVPCAGAVANALGLARLALGLPADAVEAFRRALGAFPRAVRPGEHAMVKANLALAHEQDDDPPRARLSARQALALPGAAAPVRAQAQEVLARLPGQADHDLPAVLDDEPVDRWVAVLREEVLRLVDAPATERNAVVRVLVDDLLGRAATCYDLAESLLSVVLELPPSSYGRMVDALVAAAGGRPAPEAERVRAVLGSAMARFAMPQWQRLAASLNDTAAQAGEPAGWR